MKGNGNSSHCNSRNNSMKTLILSKYTYLNFLKAYKKYIHICKTYIYNFNHNSETGNELVLNTNRNVCLLNNQKNKDDDLNDLLNINDLHYDSNSEDSLIYEVEFANNNKSGSKSNNHRTSLNSFFTALKLTRKIIVFLTKEVNSNSIIKSSYNYNKNTNNYTLKLHIHSHNFIIYFNLLNRTLNIEITNINNILKHSNILLSNLTRIPEIFNNSMNDNDHNSNINFYYNSNSNIYSSLYNNNSVFRNPVIQITNWKEFYNSSVYKRILSNIGYHTNVFFLDTLIDIDESIMKEKHIAIGNSGNIRGTGNTDDGLLVINQIRGVLIKVIKQCLFSNAKNIILVFIVKTSSNISLYKEQVNNIILDVKCCIVKASKKVIVKVGFLYNNNKNNIKNNSNVRNTEIPTINTDSTLENLYIISNKNYNSIYLYILVIKRLISKNNSNIKNDYIDKAHEPHISKFLLKKNITIKISQFLATYQAFSFTQKQSNNTEINIEVVNNTINNIDNIMVNDVLYKKITDNEYYSYESEYFKTNIITKIESLKESRNLILNENYYPPI